MFLHGCVYGVEHETVGLRVRVDGSDPTFDLDIGFHRVMAVLVPVCVLEFFAEHALC